MCEHEKCTHQEQQQRKVSPPTPAARGAAAHDFPPEMAAGLCVEVGGSQQATEGAASGFNSQLRSPHTELL